MAFRFDPYNPFLGKVFVIPAADPTQSPPRAVTPEEEEYAGFYGSASYAAGRGSPGPAAIELPASTLHRALDGCVTYVQDPQWFEMPVAPMPKSDMARLFLGQLPYFVTPMQVAWMVLELARLPVFETECIKRWGANHSQPALAQQPKGCVHTYCLPQHRDAIIAALHRRVLVDDGGVWFAEDAAQKEALEAYCAQMKQDKSLRFRDRPYQPLVVQDAVSTFVPSERAVARGAGAASAGRMTPPPPPYGAAFVPME